MCIRDRHPFEVTGHRAGPVPRRAGRGRRRQARAGQPCCRRHRAGQTRRALHAEGSGRCVEEEWPLAGGRGGGGERHDEMIPELGHYALVLALALGLIQSVAPVIGALARDGALMRLANSTAVMQFVFVAASFLALTICYVTSDFSVATVYENSHSMMPLVYKISSVWGNHEGSMLLWVLILSLFGALVAIFGANLPATLKAGGGAGRAGSAG